MGLKQNITGGHHIGATIVILTGLDTVTSCNCCCLSVLWRSFFHSLSWSRKHPTARTISGVSKIEPPLSRFSMSFPSYFPWFSNIFRDISPLFLEKFHQKMIFPMIFQYFPMIFQDISIILSPSAPRQVAGAGFESKSSVEIAWVQPLQLERAGMVQLKPPRCPARKSWYALQSRSIFIYLIHIYNICVCTYNYIWIYIHMCANFEVAPWFLMGLTPVQYDFGCKATPWRWGLDMPMAALSMEAPPWGLLIYWDPTKQ